MRSRKPQRTFFSERRVDRGDPRVYRAEQRASSPTSTDRQGSPALTPRQRDVAALLVGTGLSYKEIADRLALSEGTIRTHTERIYRALGVHSRPELTVALRAS